MGKNDDRKINSAVNTETNALMQQVLRESYLENAECLREFAEKVRALNKRKKAIREYLSSLRAYNAIVIAAARESGIDLCHANKKNLELIAQLFEEHAQSYEVSEVEYELCIPDRVPPDTVSGFAGLKNEISHWEEQLATLGEDVQLAQLDLQNWTQKLQQMLSMLSSVSKMSHESAMAIIRNMK